MPGPWIPDAVLLARFAGVVRKDPATLPADWPAQISEANKQAANSIAEILGGKGYSGPQLDAADNRCRWNVQLGLYFSLLETGAVTSLPKDVVDRFDIRQELRDSAVVLIAGVPTAPPSPPETGVGGISFGENSARAALAREYDCRFGR